MGRRRGGTWTALVFLVAMTACSIQGSGPASRGMVADEPDLAIACASPELSKPLQRLCLMSLERGDPAADARQQALDQLARYKLRPGVAPSTERWVSIGPEPIVGGSPETTWTARPRTGRVAAIAVDPSNERHWLIGAAGGGIWETFDTGASWVPRTDDQPALAMGAIAFAPSTPNIVYAGTGEAVFSLDAYGGLGVLKSTDGGRSWTHLSNTVATFRNQAFSDLAIDPKNPDIVVAAVTRAKKWIPPTSVTESGIYKTKNPGGLWELKKKGEATDLEIDPRSFDRQYAGLGDYRGADENGVYRSKNAGETWDRIDGPWMSKGKIGRIELAISPSNPDVLYVGIHDATPAPGSTIGGKILGLWKTRQAWRDRPKWEAIPLEPTDNGSGTFGYCAWNPGVEPRPVAQCWYNHELSVDPTNPDVLYAGGIALWRYDGHTWKEVAFFDPRCGIHADQHSMAWAGKRLIVGNDGGVWSTTNHGECWADHNAGLGTVQFWGGAIAPTPELLVLGGTQDNGTAVSKPMSVTWTGIIRGDAGSPAISPTRPETHWAIAGIGKGLEIWRTVDAGATMERAGDNLPEAVRTGGGIARPFQQCPANHDVVLFGDKGLWKTTDFFASRAGQPAWTGNSPEQAKLLTAVAFAASDVTCRTYAITTSPIENKSWMRMTADGGVLWRDVDPNGHLPKKKVPKGLAFDPRTPDTLYVVYTTFANEPGRVFRTGNARAAAPRWDDVSPPVDVDVPHNSIALDPVDPRIVWVGTDLGVWRGRWDDGTLQMSWTHYGPETGLPNVVVSDVKVHAASRLPVAFTHGRGAFRLVDR